MRMLALSLVLAALTVLPARADSQCHLVQAASVPMTIDDSGRITIPMTVSGKPVDMMVDTGTPMSLLTYGTARDLGLNIKNADLGAPGVWTFQMFGGLTITQYTKASDIAMGALKADSMGFGIFPGSNQLAEANGLIGDDVMANYDVDLDFANGKFNLFSKDHCAGQVVYWTSSPVAVVPFSRNIWKHIFVDVTLDGKSFLALLDTGAAESVADWEPVAQAFGLDEHSAGVVAKGSAAANNASYRYPFKTLVFGGITVNNPDITLIPRAESGNTDAPGEPELILGINVLRQLHVYIAEDEKKLYITPASAH